MASVFADGLAFANQYFATGVPVLRPDHRRLREHGHLVPVDHEGAACTPITAC